VRFASIEESIEAYVHEHGVEELIADMLEAIVANRPKYVPKFVVELMVERYGTSVLPHNCSESSGSESGNEDMEKEKKDMPASLGSRGGGSVVLLSSSPIDPSVVPLPVPSAPAIPALVGPSDVPSPVPSAAPSAPVTPAPLAEPTTASLKSRSLMLEMTENIEKRARASAILPRGLDPSEPQDALIPAEVVTAGGINPPLPEAEECDGAKGGHDIAAGQESIDDKEDALHQEDEIVMHDVDARQGDGETLSRNEEEAMQSEETLMRDNEEAMYEDAAVQEPTEEDAAAVERFVQAHPKRQATADHDTELAEARRQAELLELVPRHLVEEERAEEDMRLRRESGMLRRMSTAEKKQHAVQTALFASTHSSLYEDNGSAEPIVNGMEHQKVVAGTVRGHINNASSNSGSR